MAKAYNPIGWENGTKEADAYVTIGGVDYDVTPEQWEGNTPVDATNLDHMEKGIQNSYDVKLLAVTDTAPSECATGDIYYNTTNKLLYTATGTDTWSSTGTEPLEGILYIVFDEENNKGNSYSWNGSDLSSVGGGGGAEYIAGDNITIEDTSLGPVISANVPEEVVVSDTQPSGDDWKIWIDSGQVNNLGSEITNQYSESTTLGYSANYVNNLYKDDYELTLTSTSSANIYNLARIGNMVYLSGVLIIEGGITANTSKVIGQVPSSLIPTKVMRSSATFFDSNGNALGYGSIRVDTNGDIRPMCNTSYQYTLTTNFILMYKLG